MNSIAAPSGSRAQKNRTESPGEIGAGTGGERHGTPAATSRAWTASTSGTDRHSRNSPSAFGSAAGFPAGSGCFHSSRSSAGPSGPRTS
jgi:hypothetical protein